MTNSLRFISAVSVVLVALLAVGCATTEVKKKSVFSPDDLKIESPQSPTDRRRPQALDLPALQTSLGLFHLPQDIGVREKIFDSCKNVYVGDSTTCGLRYFTLIHVHMSCRDTEGTTDVIVRQTRPMAQRNLTFKVSGLEGTSATDGDGYAQLRVVSAKSLLHETLALTVGRQFLGKEVGDISRIILPDDWCH